MLSLNSICLFLRGQQRKSSSGRTTVVILGAKSFPQKPTPSNKNGSWYFTHRLTFMRNELHSVHGPSLWPARRFGTLYHTAWETRILAVTTSDLCWRRIYLHWTVAYWRCFSTISFTNLLTYSLTYVLKILFGGGFVSSNYCRHFFVCRSDVWFLL